MARSIGARGSGTFFIASPGAPSATPSGGRALSTRPPFVSHALAQAAAGERTAGPVHAVPLGNLPRDSARPSSLTHFAAPSDHRPVAGRFDASAMDSGPNPAVETATPLNGMP